MTDTVGQRGRALGLPVRPFLYTLDQLAFLFSLGEEHFRAAYVYYQGRSVGSPSKNLLQAINIAPEGIAPDWRVSEQEVIRWARRKGFRVRTTTWSAE